jgi:hypothetical protein
MTAPFGGELHAILSRNVLNRASLKAPTGFDINALEQDLADANGW